MNSRERVQAAVNHREGDSIPIDLGGFRASTIAAVTYHKLKKALGIYSGDVYVYDFIQQMAVIEPEVRDCLGLDLIDLGRAFLLKPEEWKDWELTDGTPCKIPARIHPVRVGDDWHVYDEQGTLIAMQKKGCDFFEQMCYPLEKSPDETFDDLPNILNKVMWVYLDVPPHPVDYKDPAALENLAAKAKALRGSSDKAIVAFFGGNLNDNGTLAFGALEWYTLMAENPGRVHRFLDRLMELFMNNLPRFMAAVGPYVDIVLYADDLGTQIGPPFSLKMYRQYYHDRFKLMWETTKKLADVKVAIHCCGGVYPLLPGLIEAGLDIFNPVQTSAKDMHPARLKREFGADLTFWGGGCDTRDVLPRGTPQEVAEDVRRRIEIFAPGGGFIFNQVHNIMPDVPVENILAMFEAAHRYGKYA